MSVLEKYIVELEKDTTLDEFTMKDVQMKLPAVKHKWTGRLIRTKLEVKQSYGKRKRLINELSEQLIEKSPVALSIPAAKKKVELHESVVELDIHIEEMKLVQEFLEKAERILSSMTFDIKNLTDIIKLETQ